MEFHLKDHIKPDAKIVFIKLKRPQAGKWVAFKHGVLKSVALHFLDERIKRGEVGAGGLDNLREMRAVAFLVA